MPAPAADRRRRRRAVEEREQLLDLGAGDPRAVVEHPDRDAVGVVVDLDLDGRAARRVLRGVREKVPQDLFDVRLLAADHADQPGWRRIGQTNSCVGQRRASDAMTRSTRWTRWTGSWAIRRLRRSSRLRTRRSSTIRNSRSASASTSAASSSARGAVLELAAKEPRAGEDRRDRRPELVRDHADERLLELLRLALAGVEPGPLERLAALVGHRREELPGAGVDRARHGPAHDEDAAALLDVAEGPRDEAAHAGHRRQVGLRRELAPPRVGRTDLDRVAGPRGPGDRAVESADSRASRSASPTG